jgi:hypothetical protein
MRIIKILAVVLVVLVILVFTIGFALPKAHVARVRTQYSASRDRVFAAIADVERYNRWRSGLEKVEVLERTPLRWRETADWGTLTFVREQEIEPVLIVTRIADEDQGFGGTWTYEIASSPDNQGSILTITENGTVSSPLFRIMSKFVFGHYRTLETYSRDLAKHLGETAEPARIN